MKIVVFDCETKRYAQEVGGWLDFRGMGLSWAEAWDSSRDEMTSYEEADLPELATLLEGADVVAGKNALDFDLPLIESLLGRSLRLQQTWDIQNEIEIVTSARIKLDDLAKATLGLGKREGGRGESVRDLLSSKSIGRLASYCRRDVWLTKELLLFVKAHGYLLAPPCVRIPLSFPGGVPAFAQEIVPPSKKQIAVLTRNGLSVPSAQWQASRTIAQMPKAQAKERHP